MEKKVPYHPSKDWEKKPALLLLLQLMQIMHRNEIFHLCVNFTIQMCIMVCISKSMFKRYTRFLMWMALVFLPSCPIWKGTSWCERF